MQDLNPVPYKIFPAILYVPYLFGKPHPVFQGEPADDIFKEAKEKGYGTIVMGRRGISGFKEFVFGSVTKRILNQSTGLSVWIVQ